MKDFRLEENRDNVFVLILPSPIFTRIFFFELVDKENVIRYVQLNVHSSVGFSLFLFLSL